MIKYCFLEDEPLRIKSATKADPQRLGEAFAAVLGADLEDPSRKKIDALIEAGRSKKHVLYPHLEWDDSAAAQAHRRDQVRQLIRCIRITRTDSEEGSIRAFESVQVNGARRSYLPIGRIEGSADLMMALMRQADKELAGMEKRYRGLKEICADIVELREKIRKRLAESETRGDGVAA